MGGVIESLAHEAEALVQYAANATHLVLDGRCTNEDMQFFIKAGPGHHQGSLGWDFDRISWQTVCRTHTGVSPGLAPSATGVPGSTASTIARRLVCAVGAEPGASDVLINTRQRSFSA